MKVFHCTHCAQLVFFENTSCVQCRRTLAYLPDIGTVGSLEPAGEAVWRSPVPGNDALYRLCENYTQQNTCNWAVPEKETQMLCRSCRFTQIVPDLSRPGNKAAWYKLELAKRRLLYTLFGLGYQVLSKGEDPERGLAFEFLQDSDDPNSAPALTGHANGKITINIAEADDSERERRRKELREPYRTLLGHFRHEVGHYFWDRLIKETDAIDAFRDCFGDERKDYSESLQNYYNNGPPKDWPDHFVTAYAAAHPWEDWSETCAHYLHMTDTIEMAAACALSLRPQRSDEPALTRVQAAVTSSSFDRLIDSWIPLTYALNNLNRCMGLPDAYPFVLSPVAIDKLKSVHNTLMSKK